MIFIDTGAFVARHLARDQHHASAVTSWQRLAADRVRCVTSNFVLDEAITLLSRAAGNHFAAERARSLMSSRELVILRPELEDETRAIELLEKYADQRVSFTDCVSFALMRRSGIGRAFTFDRHFRMAGFEVWPE